MSSAPPFSVRAGRVAFGGDVVLTGVDLTIERGDFLALLGDNGSGKTTLLRVLLGLQPLSAGSVDVFGEPARRFRDWGRIAYVPQHLLGAGAVPVSVREVVAAGLGGSRHRRRGSSPPALRRSLEHVGLWERRSDAFAELSGGQQRRVMIASALAKEAEVILLDEPTSGVDAANLARLVTLLVELKEQRRTIVLVTHELGPLATAVTRCLVLGRGGEHSVQYDGPGPLPAALQPGPHPHHPEGSEPGRWRWEAGT